MKINQIIEAAKSSAGIKLSANIEVIPGRCPNELIKILKFEGGYQNHFVLSMIIYGETTEAESNFEPSSSFFIGTKKLAIKTI